jgi:hypothetical protein
MLETPNRPNHGQKCNLLTRCVALGKHDLVSINEIELKAQTVPPFTGLELDPIAPAKHHGWMKETENVLV